MIKLLGLLALLAYTIADESVTFDGNDLPSVTAIPDQPTPFETESPLASNSAPVESDKPQAVNLPASPPTTQIPSQPSTPFETEKPIATSASVPSSSAKPVTSAPVTPSPSTPTPTQPSIAFETENPQDNDDSTPFETESPLPNALSIPVKDDSPAPSQPSTPLESKKPVVESRSLEYNDESVPVKSNRALPTPPKPVQATGTANSHYVINPDGSYEYGYENKDGDIAEQRGQLKTIGSSSGNFVEGFYQYTDKGETIVVKYVSDENGYRPISDAIPTPPPIPVYILRALEWNAAHALRTDKEQ